MRDKLRGAVRGAPARYATAVLVVAASFPLYLTLQDNFGLHLPPFILLYPAVMVVAVMGGLWPGVLATVLAAAGADYFLLDPRGHLTLASPTDALALAIFCIMGISMSGVAERYRRGQRRIADYEAEKIQRDAETVYRNLFNTMDEGFCVIEVLFDVAGRAVDFRFLEVNPSYALQTGIPNPLGKTMREIAPDLEDYWFEVYGKVAQTGEMVHVLHEAKAIDGFYDVRAYRVGEPEQRRVAVVFNEISDRMREERALREQAELIDLAHDTIMVRGLDGTILSWNRGAEEMYGFTREEAIGRTPHELLRTVFPQPLEEIEARLLEKGRWDGELRHTSKNGSRIVVVSRWALKLGQDGQPAGVMEIHSDISERKRAEEHTEKLYRVYTVLSDINQTIVREKDTQTMLEEACRIAVDRGQFRMAWIGMADAATGELKPIAWSGTVDGYLDRMKIDLCDTKSGTGPAVQCFATGKYATCDDIERDLFRPWKADALKNGYRSVAAFPLRCEDKMVGVFCLYAGEHSFFDDDEIHVLDEMAMDISYAMEVNLHDEARRDAEGHIRRLNRVYAVLSDINETIVRERDSQAMLQSACRIAVEKGQFLMAWIGMVNRATGLLKPIALSGLEDGYLSQIRIYCNDPETAGPAAACVRTGQHSLCNDLENEPEYRPWREDALQRGYRSSAAFPLKVDGETVGVFSLYAGQRDFFTGDELSLLDDMAMDVSFALEVDAHERERLRADEELRWRTAFFEAQIESAIDGVMVVNDKGERLLRNQRLVEMFGIPSDIPPGSDDTRQRNYVATVMKKPGDYLARFDELNADPQEQSRDEVELIDGKVLERCSSPVRDKSGTHYGRIWTFRDITERRLLEEQVRQAQKMEAIGQLTGGIAHDFNNLLTVIMGCSEFIGREVSGNARLTKMSAMVVNAAKRGAELTHRMLAFARRQALEPKPVDVNRLLAEMEEFLRRTLGAEVELHVIKGGDDSVAIADHAQLENALINLCVNARDAMAGGGHLSVEVGTAELDESYAAANPGVTPGQYVRLVVSDTGCGISPEHMARVFEPFFTTKGVGKGTGLGLSMVYGFAKQSQGHVKLYSEVGRGTSVRLYLPRASQSNRQTTERPTFTSEGVGAECVLLVEDDAEVRDFAQAQLADLGYRVLSAANGSEALEVIRTHPEIDLLFTDVVMPGGINGRELATEACVLNPALKVLYCSGFAESAIVHNGLLDRGIWLLNKPYSRAELGRMLRNALTPRP